MTDRDRAWDAAAAVTDPELPPLTIADLGILRTVSLHDGTVEVAITPSYSGCPAMRTIEGAIEDAVRTAGFARVMVRRVLAPPWTTDWLTPAAHEKLAQLGIAPPSPGVDALFARPRPACPRCGAADTELISAFGATACKSLHRCRSCREPFEAFKCH